MVDVLAYLFIGLGIGALGMMFVAIFALESERFVFKVARYGGITLCLLAHTVMVVLATVSIINRLVS
jgi:hypothetical protein